jgi:acyl-coenzyme A synthetase/AMP-(fatty) acid ligase
VNVADLVAECAARAPQAPAIVEPTRTISYQALDRAIWRAAADLRGRGIGVGDVVALRLDTHALHLVVSYALARIGAVQLALSPRDSEEARAHLAKRFGARVVLGDADVREEWLAASAAPVDESLRFAGGDGGWKIVLSSGTTGRPKALLRSHAMAFAGCRMQSAATGLTASDRCHAMDGLEFLISLSRCLDAHFVGAAVVFAPAWKTGIEFFSFLEKEKVSVLSLGPTRLLPLLDLPRPAVPRAHGLRVLRTDAIGMKEPMRKKLAEYVTPRLFQSYGTTEAGLLAFGFNDTLAQHPGTAGFVAPGVQLEIVDEAGATLPPGSVGRVRARTPAMGLAYLDDPEVSAKTFIDGWYYPGDLGSLSDDGLLSIRGRSDDVIDAGGTKIYAIEIETALLQHPEVADVAAFAVQSAGAQIPVAAVVLRGGSIPELIAWCNARLGARAPKAIVKMDRLPTNPAGKVLKREMAERVAGALKKRP